jgi:CRP-like cAMP-binding protein
MRHDLSVIEEYGRLSPFQRCSSRELERINGLSTPVAVEPGHMLARQGSLCGEFAIIVGGKAVVNRNGYDVDELGRGDCFGEIPLVRCVPNPTTITALTPMRLEVMDVREFRSVYTTMPTVRDHVDGQVDHRIRTWLVQPASVAPLPDSVHALAHESAAIGYTVAQ